MKWSFKLVKLAGINVYVHWTFVLLLAWIGLGNLIEGEGKAALRDVGLMVMVFSFIVLHELGHALTARRFGIRTRDITLLPIGGVARLERMPEDPREEFLVAIAGPAVNFALAATAFIIAVLVQGLNGFTDVEQFGTNILATAFIINIGMGVFNLLPAFPMDGGRILRAFLVRRMGYVAATETAASVGQFLAIMLGILGLFTNGMLIFVALFVYLGAHNEALQVQMKSILSGVPVREAMRTHFMSLFRDDDITSALKQFLAGNQHDFPVVDDDRTLCGMVYREDILNALENDPEALLVDEVMQTNCGIVSVNAMLDDALHVMNERDCSVLPVIEAGRVIGLVSLENIGAFMMIQSARKHGHSASRRTPFFHPFEHQSTSAVHEDNHVESTPIA